MCCPDNNAREKKERLSKLDYIYYILVTLVILFLCIYLVRIPGSIRLGNDKAALAERARNRRERNKRRGAGKSSLASRHGMLLKRNLKNVPTPWGWPGHDAGFGHDGGTSIAGTPGGPHKNSVSDTLHRWVDHLTVEKRTVEDQEYVLKKAASMRAMMEDRYGRASQMSSINYKKTKAPLLRDPSRPYDQMDNFPSGKGDKIISGLDAQPSSSDQQDLSVSLGRTKALKEVKTPWGW